MNVVRVSGCYMFAPMLFYGKAYAKRPRREMTCLWWELKPMWPTLESLSTLPPCESLGAPWTGVKQPGGATRLPRCGCFLATELNFRYYFIWWNRIKPWRFHQPSTTFWFLPQTKFQRWKHFLSDMVMKKERHYHILQISDNQSN